MSTLRDLVPAGVITGDNVLKLMTFCRDHEVALPAFNVTSSSTANAILQAARDNNSAVIIQVRILFDFIIFIMNVYRLSNVSNFLCTLFFELHSNSVGNAQLTSDSTNVGKRIVKAGNFCSFIIK